MAKVWLKLDKNGTIIRYQINPNIEKVKASDEMIVELDDVPDFGGGKTIPAYRWDGNKIVRRSSKEISKDIKKVKSKSRDLTIEINRKNESDYYKIFSEIAENAKRISDLLFVGIILALTISFVASGVVALILEYNLILLILLIISILITIFLFLMFAIKAIAKRQYSVVIPTAITIDIEKDSIALPRTMRMKPRISSIYWPFIINAISVYEKVKKSEFLKQDSYEMLNVAIVATLFKGLINILSKVDSFETSELGIDKGPITGMRRISQLKYYLKDISYVSKDGKDVDLLKFLFPEIDLIRLPIGVNFSISLFGRKQPKGLVISTREIKLTLNSIYGNGSGLHLSTWKRSFDTKADKLYVNAIGFNCELEFTGASFNFFKIFNRRGYWDTNEYLSWFINLMDWLKEYLDWLEDEDEINMEEAFDLVESNPPHYKYRGGAIPPGDGHVIFGSMPNIKA